MTIECYYAACPAHSCHNDPDDGPFCYEQECLRTPLELKFLARTRALEMERDAQKDKLRAENEKLRNYLRLIEHATSPMPDDNGYHENAYSLAQAALRGEGNER